MAEIKDVVIEDGGAGNREACCRERESALGRVPGIRS